MNPSIWTPRYIINRVRLFLYEKKHTNEPWIPEKAVRALERMLHQEMKGVEFGSGRSTVWYAQRVKDLVSIEDHKEWFNEVKTQLATSKVTNVDYVFKSSQTDKTGRSEYCNYIDTFKNESLHFIVVDGKHRDRVAYRAIEKLESGGILLLDDSERYLAYASKAPYALGEDSTKMTSSWREFSKQVATWKTQTYTNGVSDTTLFIKP